MADATPHRMLREASVVGELRRLLDWTERRDPLFSDLHPSLGNMDHAATYIDQLKSCLYPHGVDFAGARISVDSLDPQY